MADTLKVLSGKETDATIVLKLLADIKISRTLPYLFGIGCLVIAMLTERLRRETIGYMSKRISELEKRLDLRRSSSRLTEKGATRPEDA